MSGLAHLLTHPSGSRFARRFPSKAALSSVHPRSSSSRSSRKRHDSRRHTASRTTAPCLTCASYRLTTNRARSSHSARHGPPPARFLTRYMHLFSSNYLLMHLFHCCIKNENDMRKNHWLSRTHLKIVPHHNLILKFMTFVVQAVRERSR